MPLEQWYCATWWGGNNNSGGILSEVQKVVGEGVKCVCAAAGETVELSLYPF